QRRRTPAAPGRPPALHLFQEDLAGNTRSPSPASRHGEIARYPRPPARGSRPRPQLLVFASSGNTLRSRSVSESGIEPTCIAADEAAIYPSAALAVLSLPYLKRWTLLPLTLPRGGAENDGHDCSCFGLLPRRLTLVRFVCWASARLQE